MQLFIPCLIAIYGRYLTLSFSACCVGLVCIALGRCFYYSLRREALSHRKWKIGCILGVWTLYLKESYRVYVDIVYIHSIQSIQFLASQNQNVPRSIDVVPKVLLHEGLTYLLLL